jgi:hypothetical protein
VGAALVFGKGNRKTLLLAFLGILVALFINPRGWQTWQYVYQSLTVPSNQLFSMEWMPPINQGWQMNLFFLWLLAFPLLAVFSPRKLSALEWCWFIVFGFMALWGLRYGIWFILLLAIFTSELLADWEKRWLSEAKDTHFAVNLAVPILFIFFSLAFLPGLRSQWWKQSPGTTKDTPVAATEWLKNHPELKGPLFSEMGFSSYLEFVLPERPVWIDTRMFAFPTSSWVDYSAINAGSWNWESDLKKTGANLLMVSVDIQPKLVSALALSPDWCRVYVDDVAEIYTRGGCTQ